MEPLTPHDWARLDPRWLIVLAAALAVIAAILVASYLNLA